MFHHRGERPESLDSKLVWGGIGDCSVFLKKEMKEKYQHLGGCGRSWVFLLLLSQGS